MANINYHLAPPADFNPIPDSILENTLIARFEETAEKFPARMAIEAEEHRLTYRELNNAVNELARRILTEMGEDRSPVAFLFHDEVLSVIALMAIQKAGRVFVGLHPSNAVEQLAAYFADSTASLLIASPDLRSEAESMVAGRGARLLFLETSRTDSAFPNPGIPLRGPDPQSIFYTSGSTGTPKGILLPHSYLAQWALYQANDWYLSPSDRIAMVTSVCFLAAYTSLLGALLNGGTLCMLNLKNHSAQAALDWIREARLTIFRCTPSIFRTLFGQAPAGLIFDNLRFITLGGEPATEKDVALFKAHTAPGCVLINNFAASEVGMISHYPVTHQTPPFGSSLPAGFAVPGKEILLLDENGNEAEPGQEGEIAIRSRYLSLGYWRQPEMTARKFFDVPDEPGLRVCHLGDRGRWREDGALEVLGRKDTQVKIRGYRVQLEAVDAALGGFPGVMDAATVVYRAARGGERLAAYVCMKGPEPLSVSKMRRHLSALLPGYMIPSAFVQVESLPRTPTGKLARLQLPELSNIRPDIETPFVAPRNETERVLASIWEDVLEVTGVGVNDNFFELGGDSLMALEMTLEVEKALSIVLPQSVFAESTIAALAQATGRQAPTAEEDDKFILASFRKAEQEKTGRASRASLGKLATRKYSTRDMERLFDQAVAFHITGKPCLEARAWSARWSRNAFVCNLFYRRRRAMFAEFVAGLDGCQVSAQDAFPLNLLYNLGFSMMRYLGADWRQVRNDLAALKRAPRLFWKSLGELIETASEDRLRQAFRIEGLEHLLQARRDGRGAILLTFHGTNAPGLFTALARMLDVGDIPTISHRIPARQSEFGDETDNLSYEVASALNTEIAMYAQKRLRAGETVNVVGDTSDAHGRRFELNVGGRLYQIKAGFAELALNTGAAILPHHTILLPDGTPQLNIEPPLSPAAGDRASQVESLIHAYAQFISRAWRAHPEAVGWTRIRRHLAQPIAS
jgi:amino acid adenylation domain-containing protein